MLDNDKLDDLYSSAFENFELPVSDKLLANIKQELVVPNKVSKIAYWKWILSSILVATGLALAYFTFTNSNKNIVNQQTVNSIDSINANNLTAASDSNNTVKNTSTTITENKNNDVTDATTNNSGTTEHAEKSNNTETKQKEEDILNKNVTIVSNSNNSTSETNSKKKQIEKKNNSSDGSNNVVNSNKTNSNTTSSATSKTDNKKANSATALKTKNNSTNANTKNEKENSSLNKQSSSNNVNDSKQNNASVLANNKNSTTTNSPNKQSTTNNVNDSKQNDASVVANNKNSTATNSQKNEPIVNATTPKTADNASNKSESIAENKSLKSSTDSSTAKQDSIKATKNSAAADSVPPKIVPENKPDKKTTAASNVAFFIDVNGGFSSAFRSLSGSNTSIASRNESEKKIATYNLGIDVGALIKNKFLISVGVGLDNKGEKYSFGAIKEVHDTAYLYWHDTLGNAYPYSPHDTIIVAAAEAKQIQHTYQFLKIPIMVGYCFTVKDKLFITPSVGLSINYLLSASSSWFDQASKKYIDYNKSDSKFSSFTLAGRVKLDIGFNLTDKWSISIQPAYTRFLQSIYRKDDDKKLYPYSYDLNVGVRYKF